MAITEDVSSPASVQSNSAITVTTAMFSPPANTLLVAMVSCNGSSSGATTCSVSDSGAHTWTLQKRANSVGGGVGGGSAEVWTFYTTAALTNITVTGQETANTFNGILLSVKVLNGATQAQPGVTGSVASSTAVSPTVSITPTKLTSRVYGAFTDYTSNVAVSPNANTTTITTDADATNGDTYTTFKGANATSSLVSTSFGYSTPSTCQTNLVVVEILPLVTPPAPRVITQPANARASYW